MASSIPSRKLAACLGLAALACEPVLAQNPNYAPGDLVLFFQKEGGGNTVYARLGNAATAFRGTAAGPDGTNQVNFLDINAELTAAFGAGWASDPSVHAGLAGCWSNGTSSTLQNGDPQRTLYVSCPRVGEGTVGTANSNGWDMTLAGNTAMTTGASAMISMNNVLETSYTTAVTVSPVGTSLIDDNNPISGGIQGNAFNNTFGGGVQQAGSAGSWGSFGAAGGVEFALDLYRILARGTGGSGGTAPVAGQVAGDLRVGSYEGTITVNSSGQVSFISQGAAPSSPFTSWADSFAGSLPNATDRLPTADPDGDGLNNLMEFVLDGNPGVSDAGISPVLDASGSNFVFGFNRRDDSETEAPVVFQYSSDLGTWTDVPVGATSAVTGSATITVTENGTGADAISVSIPKSVSANGRLFGRIKAVR